MWWYGPDFIYNNSSHWPKNSISDFADISEPETKKQKKHNQTFVLLTPASLKDFPLAYENYCIFP